MTARVLDGKAVAMTVRADVAARAAARRAREIVRRLAVVLVGDEPASQVYVRSKTRAALEAGVDPVDHRLPATASQDDVLGVVDQLNRDATVDGILVQLPLPRHIDADRVIASIDPAKDVDGLHPHSLGLLAQGRPSFVPCTPRGCMRLLAEAGTPIEGATAVVLGRSVLVGKPVALLLAAANATVTLCHSRTRDLAAEVARADIVVAAIGKPELV